MDKVRKKVKKKSLIDAIRENPIFGQLIGDPMAPKKVKVPVDGGTEPRWRPGRDKPGGGRGGTAGSDEGELIYIEMDYDEWLELFFESLELPFLLKKDEATTIVKSQKRRGIQPTGPKARLNKKHTAIARLKRVIGQVNAQPDKFEDTDRLPGVDEIPFAKIDMRYDRIEERFDPDSKAVVFFVLDRSGSMMGEPLAIAKAFFLINLIFLRSKYKDVRVVMIPHDARAYRITDEKDFYRIEVDGGTMFVPAYELVWEIAQNEFPASVWNRYMFHATDGYMFDSDTDVTNWWARLVRGDFNYCGYLEIDPWAAAWGRGARDWAPGGEALLDLPDDVMAHVGMAKVASMEDLPDAFREILTKDKKLGGR